MSYILIIRKTVPNENYAKEVADFEEKNRFRGGRMDYQDESIQKNITTNALVMECSEKQVEAIKKAALVEFK